MLLISTYISNPLETGNIYGLEAGLIHNKRGSTDFHADFYNLLKFVWYNGRKISQAEELSKTFLDMPNWYVYMSVCLSLYIHVASFNLLI